jgi:hypothetical protein
MFHIALAAFVVAAAWPSSVRAQAEPQLTEHPEVQWYEAWYVKFKNSDFYEAEKLIYEHLVPVELAISRPTLIMEHRTGEWDFVVYFPMEGPGDLEQRQSPAWKKWWKAFVELRGEERAEEITSRLGDLVVRDEHHLVEGWRHGEQP